MHHFVYKNEELYCEDVPIKQIADQIRTPFYLYSHATLVRHFNAFDSAFDEIKHLTCFSVKSNSNIAILRLFSRLGAGADIVSGGELYRAIKAGINPAKIVYSGVGKREDEMEYAINSDILMFNVESHQELLVLNKVAKRLNKTARISIRVNPDIDPKTHPYISTGMKENKFGISIEEAFEEYRFASKLSNIEIIGISCHIGSQLLDVQPFVDSLKRLLILAEKLKKAGISIRYLDIGGGLGIRYSNEQPPHPKEYAEAIKKEIKEKDICLILEPGRVIVGNAGILVTRLLYKKEQGEKKFFIVDAGMNDLIRPSLYGSYHEICPVRKRNTPFVEADIVGPICESGDFFARKRKIQDIEPGELLAIMSAGAYGFVMSSNYNSRPRPCEVMVKGKEFFIIRERETYEDLIRGESIPDFLM
ncbi:MAG: diaminopimelate decarboxylase [Deltaproteobacteria bacterium]|nr:MAG: diaminopimelate decarboxylase [Deltaproteobacteria bacterium]